jgi:PAS domain S-box-containing protein/putative nucleotidyltransferase with HDIG domain
MASKEKIREQSTDELLQELSLLRDKVKELSHLEAQHALTRAQLEETNTFLRNILESSSSISIISTDLDHNIIYWNKGAEKIFGYKAAEVVGSQKIDILYPEEEAQGEMEKIRTQIFKMKENMNCEIQELTKKGSRVWINMNLTPRFDDNDKVIGVLGIGEDISERKRAEERLMQSLKKLRKALMGVIHVMELTVETRDPYTAGHQRRVANLALYIAKEMGLPVERIDGLQLAGIVHDLGKISVPAEILIKPGKLNEIQFDMIKTHPQIGYDILKNIEFPWPIAQIILQHHERMDGSGYPAGLGGDDLLLESRILAVADVVEAMASHRPYRASLGIQSALTEISKNKSSVYDEEVVDACLSLFNDKGFELEQIMDELTEPSVFQI